jgi:hypothetical protein
LEVFFVVFGGGGTKDFFEYVKLFLVFGGEDCMLTFVVDDVASQAGLEEAKAVAE